MFLTDRRCANCHSETGPRPDGTFAPYTLHPFTAGSGGREKSETFVVFCASCFEALGTAAARDHVAATLGPARLRVVGE